MFGLPEIGGHLIFKGGTSLSKVYQVIERFSEDIDISIDRGWLGFGGANEPEAGASNKEKQRRLEALKTACQEKIAIGLQPALTQAIAAKVGKGEQWSLRADEEDPDRQTFLLVSGKPLREPVAWYGPIVMNTQEHIRQAYEELQTGTFLKAT